MITPILLLVLCLAGTLETTYLIHKRKQKEHPVCVIGEGCSVVLDSKYNKTLGIHNDILGLLFYLIATGVFAFSYFAPVEHELIPYLTPVTLGIGTLSSLFFMSIQFGVLKSFCFWCTTSAITIFLMDIVYLLDL